MSKRSRRLSVIERLDIWYSETDGTAYSYGHHDTEAFVAAAEKKTGLIFDARKLRHCWAYHIQRDFSSRKSTRLVIKNKAQQGAFKITMCEKAYMQ